MSVKAGDIPKLYNRHGSLKSIARETGESWRQVQKAYKEAVAKGLMTPLPLGRKTHSELKLAIPKQRPGRLKTHSSRHKAYILTCAQNNTDIHEPTWKNLLALAAHYDAKIMVSTFLYARRSAWQAKLDKGAAGPQSEIWYDHRVVPFINNNRVEIAKGLVWCGELNISPTAERPLSGLEVYTGRASMIAPHTHVQMQSIATIGGSGTKFNYTTGTVTLRNYIQRKEGFKAEFHHVYGALLVETDDKGHWWVRQLSADSEGTIYDLDVKAEGGKISTGHAVEAINFGDIHVAQIDPVVRDATWGPGGMVDTLKPRYQIAHDILDFYGRAHHTIKNPYTQYLHYVEKKESVQDEVNEVRMFVAGLMCRNYSEVVIVNSNHDRFIQRWLAETDGRKDPVNARYWSALNMAVLSEIEETKAEPDYLSLVLSPIKARVLPLNESFVICKDIGGGIECGLHGDLGPNGARGALRSFARMGRRTNTGHSHVAGIDGGGFQAGTKTKLRLSYNNGPSSWSQSDIITYPNSKRAIVTFFDGKYRA